MCKNTGLSFERGDVRWRFALKLRMKVVLEFESCLILSS